MKNNSSGITLLELMIATAILVVAISGLLAIFTGFFYLNEHSRKFTLAMTAVEDKIEEIRETDFDTVLTSYNATSFEPAGFPAAEAEGVIYVSYLNPDLLEVRASVSWTERSNKIIGEDINLNGSLDTGEDTNGNNMLSSPAEIVTLMGKR